MANRPTASGALLRVLSLGLTALMLIGFLATNALGQASAADPPTGQSATASGNASANQTSSSTRSVGGNVNNPQFTTGTTTTGTVTITTRSQSGPERVLVCHIVNGRPVNADFLPVNSDVVTDVLASPTHTRVRGNEEWVLGDCPSITTTTTTSSTTTSSTSETTTTSATTTTTSAPTSATTTTTSAPTGATTTTTGAATGATATTTAVAGSATSVAAATTQSSPSTVVAGVATTASTSSPSVAVTASSVAATVAGVSTTVAAALPPTGGVPLDASAVAGLGLLLSGVGVALRRSVR